MVNQLKHPKSYDDVIIGSSPLMIMQAIHMARAGRRVCLLERVQELGGNWRVVKLNNGDEVEVACHLIEVFPGIYDLLEEYSGVQFVPLDIQPIRIIRRDFRVNYFSRALMLASGGRLIMGLMRSYIDIWRGAALDHRRILNFKTKLFSYLKYQLPAFIGSSQMKGPKGGFANFIKQLCDRAREEGVTILKLDVTELILKKDMFWQITGKDQKLVFGQKVHVTTSAHLAQVAPSHFVASSTKFVRRACVVVDCLREDVIVNHTYVAFWADPLISRIARIDHTGPSRPTLRFLVEFHNPDLESVGDWQNAVQDRMVNSKIIANGSTFEIMGQVICTFTSNVDQLQPGKLDNNLWAYYSEGNLAAGLAAWRKLSNSVGSESIYDGKGKMNDD